MANIGYMQVVRHCNQYCRFCSNPATGWMLVEKGVLSAKHDLMVPLTVVDDANPDTHEVYLAVSQADLERMQHLEPATVVFVDAEVTESS